MIRDRAPSTGGSIPAPCTHPHRVRENRWGWYGAETVCLGCGQGFDPDEEERLRRGENPAPSRQPDRIARGEHTGP